MTNKSQLKSLEEEKLHSIRGLDRPSRVSNENRKVDAEISTENIRE